MLSFLRKAKGVLGINARNLHYVSRYNNASAKKFADDKLYTKRFLQSRHIGVAKLYHVIKTYPELQNLDFNTLPNSFVIKPNRGYGGEGIIVITEKTKNGFISISGDKLSFEEIYYHCIDILDGKYAISGTHDQVLIEEFLASHDVFSGYVTEGLPDIRIIVFNFVPVIGMLRIPTNESHGKANLHLGAIGVGIDMGTGKTTYAIRHNRYIRKFPNGEPVNSIVLPYWNEILETASKIQQISKIGYLAVDLAITKTGIKVLEVNARAGLSVQIANRSFLKTRLEKVLDLKISNSLQGVEIAKTLFSTKLAVKPEIKLKPVIGLYEPATILMDKNQEIITKINPHGTHNLIDKNLIKSTETVFDVLIKSKRLRLNFKKIDLGQQRYKAVIAGKYLGEYLIDCKKPFPLISKKIPQQDIKILENIDKKITEIDSQIHLLSAIKPRNLKEEKIAFFENFNRSPHFIYKAPKTEVILLEKELDKIPQQIDHPLFPLYKDKIMEIQYKLKLIQSINTSNFTKYSEKIFGKVDLNLVKQAKKFIKKTNVYKDESPILKFKEVIEIIETFLKQTHLSHWKIKVLEESPTDMQVNKNNTIFIRENVRFSTNRLQALIMHEIETHIFRLENGRLQPFSLLTRGTANYLRTEEGLAIYNQNKLGIHFGDKVLWPALNVIAIYYSKMMSFVDLFHFLKENYELENDLAWKICVKVKRGLCDTNKKLSFTKDLIYFTGERLIEQYLMNKQNKIKDLYIGKIGVEDLAILNKFQSFKVKYLPELYR